MRAMLGPMTIRLVMITHAPTAATREARFPADEPLDARGATAMAGADRGAPRRFDRVVRGPERRCDATSQGLGLDAIVDPALTDLDLGAWRGRTLPELESSQPVELGAWLTDPHAAPHGGESLSSLVERVTVWLDELPGERVRMAAITHPAIVRAAVLRVLGAPLSCFWRLDSAPLTQTWLTRHGGRWQLRETGHPLTPSGDAG